MFNNNPWMLLLWIIALVMALIPLLIILWSGIIAGYFKAKESHIAKVTKALGSTLDSFSDGILKKMNNKEDKEKENKE